MFFLYSIFNTFLQISSQLVSIPNKQKEELLELEEHPEMIPEMLRDEMSTKISLLITYISPNETQKRSRNEMNNNENIKRTRGGRYRNKRRRTRKYKW